MRIGASTVESQMFALEPERDPLLRSSTGHLFIAIPGSPPWKDDVPEKPHAEQRKQDDPGLRFQAGMGPVRRSTRVERPR